MTKFHIIVSILLYLSFLNDIISFEVNYWNNFQRINEKKELNDNRLIAARMLRKYSNTAIFSTKISDEEEILARQMSEITNEFDSKTSKLQSLESLLQTVDLNRDAIVLIAGFEKFNSQLYKNAASELQSIRPDIPIFVFTDTDIVDRPNEVSEALSRARVLLCSLIFDYTVVKWLKEHINGIPYRFCFESALELMAETKVDSFNMMTTGNSKAGPPPAVQAILKQFSKTREEDKMAGYIKLLKVGPKLLKFVPGTNLGGIKTWITVYSYWTESGIDNIVSMLKIIINDCGFSSQTDPKNIPMDANRQWIEPIAVKAVKEYPSLGIYHPLLSEVGETMTDPQAYVKWYLSTHSWVKEETPRVGVLLYRKHVISEQGYIGNMINLMESNEIMPIPIYINGVEGHTVVRDLFTSAHEQLYTMTSSSLSPNAVKVDAVVNTIGFPLVGGPAGSMEGGRSIEAAKEILESKNIPYIVAAPLLIQDIDSWQRNGVQGLQTVVLYSLPELDGAIDTIVLGGLVGEKIVVIPERVRKLCYRLKAWVSLRKEKPESRRLAVLVYGFPPNVGSVGTAALLNVGSSLSNLFGRLQSEGFNVGDVSQYDGEAIISALRFLYNDATSKLSPKAIHDSLLSSYFKQGSFEVVSEEIGFRDLKSWLGKDASSKMEKQWGDLERYTGIGASRSTGRYSDDGVVFRIIGLKFGNLFLGMQPLLGIEGDPMRLLFERDLTPHPQYAAFYQYLNRIYQPHAMLHFGMHGTVEWLPGSPLGSTAESWPDILLGTVPNLYLYACNNPSESILAKRRGYATIVSHNVPPYSRSGLYKELVLLREALNDYRQTAAKAMMSNNNGDDMKTVRRETDLETGVNVKEVVSKDLCESVLVVSNIANKIGLWQDCPFLPHITDDQKLSYIESIMQDETNEASLQSFLVEFSKFSEKLSNYLAELENRLFSEGLHILGRNYTETELRSYLDACYTPLTEQQYQLPSEIQGTSVASADINLAREGAISAIANSVSTNERVGEKEFASIIGTVLSTDSSSLGGPRANSASIESQFVSELLHTRRIGNLVEYVWENIRSALGDVESKRKVSNVLLSHALSKRMNATSFDQGPSLSEFVEPYEPVIRQIESLRDLASKLKHNTELEMQSLVRGLKGEFILPAPGGDVVRDGVAVLPTGRNIHALDPYRIPSQSALQRGRQAADLIIENHRKTTKDGSYPQTVSVNLWGLDTIKTKGESIGIVLGLIGAEPVREATGRIVAFQLIPLSDLKRPRIDVLGSLSGIFRDALSNVCDLLDDLFYQAATADEPVELNYIKLNAQSMTAQGIDRSYSRLFSNPPGDFGSMVGEQVGSGDWDDSKELGNTWLNRNSFSYGKSSEKGAPRGDVLKSLLNTTDRIVQQVDSVEYGLTDIYEYFSNTGALKKAAENIQGQGSRVNVSIVEAFDKVVRPKELESVLRMEYRTKLLNPKWAAAMLKQGSGGAYEISGRLTGLIGWSSTAGFQEQWVYDGAAQRYIEDEEVARKLRELNPEAFRNILKRMMEANGRGYWKASDSMMQKLEEMYADVDDEIEGV